ncbi:MAG: hypothetical protein KDB32_07235 [Planctomycetes bacterium]|nr:hypothetical protein [Planctomycetota bacterium]
MNYLTQNIGNKRTKRRGGVLGLALMFAALVAVAGGALLSMTTVNRLKMVRSSNDVRLMIAAEAGIETVRGRFTLVAGVQDDWSALLPTSGWNNIDGPLTISGIKVQCQAKPTGDPSTPQARIRAIAYGSDQTRVVEYLIQAANFADYALYFGSNNTVGIGDNFKMVGNFYSKGHVNLTHNSGIEFFGSVDTMGKVMNYSDRAYNFKKGFTEYAPEVNIPPAAYGMDVMRAAAQASNTLFYANTLSIELKGTKFERTFEYRYKGKSNNYKHKDYQVKTELLDIPDNSVIYIDSSSPPNGVDSYSNQSSRANQASNGSVQLWGVLDYSRVTVASENDIEVTNNISYQTLLDNPDLRRFTQKKKAAALAYREMLGVISGNDVNFMTADWSSLGYWQRVTDDASLTPPDTGHEYYQYSIDGVYMGAKKARRGNNASGNNKELWVCGGIINGDHPTTELSSNFDRRNYDTDYRLQKTTPPYFLKAYGEAANMIKGTWRTYEL